MAKRGCFPLSELATFDAIDSRLQAHPDMTKLPWLDMSSGSLGQGLSVGIGMALAARLRDKAHTTYVMLGDGEVQEGQVWEAAFVASRYELGNLDAIVDLNKLQQYGWRKQGAILPPVESPDAQWESFGWRVWDVDGHDVEAFVAAVLEAKEASGQPSVVIAHTVKGKGGSFMEHDFSWHARVPTDDELAKALAELGLENTETVQ